MSNDGPGWEQFAVGRVFRLELDDLSLDAAGSRDGNVNNLWSCVLLLLLCARDFRVPAADERDSGTKSTHVTGWWESRPRCDIILAWQMSEWAVVLEPSSLSPHIWLHYLLFRSMILLSRLITIYKQNPWPFTPTSYHTSIKIELLMRFWPRSFFCWMAYEMKDIFW